MWDWMKFEEKVKEQKLKYEC
jgi:hypothetical protein